MAEAHHADCGSHLTVCVGQWPSVRRGGDISGIAGVESVGPRHQKRMLVAGALFPTLEKQAKQADCQDHDHFAGGLISFHWDVVPGYACLTQTCAWPCAENVASPPKLQGWGPVSLVALGVLCIIAIISGTLLGQQGLSEAGPNLE